MTGLSQTDRIERDLVRTRARMDGRLDEVQAHLTPRPFANDAFAYVQGGDGADFVQDLVFRIRANPLPVALAGIGIAWLMASTSDTSPRPAPKPTGAHAGADATLGRIKDAAGDRAAAMQQGVPDMSRSARDTLSSLSGNPFALGAIAAVVGAVAGALIPTLDEEEAALGSVATKVRTAGRDFAQDVVDRGGRIADETLGAIKDSVASHGLTADKPVGALIGEVRSGSLAEDVRQVAQKTLQDGRDSVRTHLSGDPAASGQDD